MRVEEVPERIRDFVIRTPAIRDFSLSEVVGRPVYLKLENLQRTGAFKIRGAAARMLALADAERSRGIVAVSSGNHGRAVAHVARRLRIPAVICVPQWIDPVKAAGMRAEGARVELAGSSYDEAETVAREMSARHGLTDIHPFDDPFVIAGQGTIGIELTEQVPELGAVVVPLSGGGLVAGIAEAVKRVRQNTAVLAVSALNASVMVQSLKAGRPLELPEQPTLANALQGGIDMQNSYTFTRVRELVDEHASVDEQQIGSAMRWAGAHGLVVEGGGAVGLAHVLERGPLPGNGPVAVVISGGNVDPGVWAGVMTEA